MNKILSFNVFENLNKDFLKLIVNEDPIYLEIIDNLQSIESKNEIKYRVTDGEGVYKVYKSVLDRVELTEKLKSLYKILVNKIEVVNKLIDGYAVKVNKNKIDSFFNLIKNSKIKHTSIPSSEFPSSIYFIYLRNMLYHSHKPSYGGGTFDVYSPDL